MLSERRANIGAAVSASWAAKSEAQREATYASRRGRTLTPEHRARIGASLTGKQLTPQHKEAILHPPVKGECVYCFGPATERDHPYPGEPETVLSCRLCNNSKNDRTPEEWLADGLYGRRVKEALRA